MRACICVQMIEWGVCARPCVCVCVCEKACDKVGEHCVGVLYSGHNVSGKKKSQAVKTIPQSGGWGGILLASLNSLT